MDKNTQKYLHWDEKVVTDFSEKNIVDLYDRGYVFTRIGRGVMHQTRSVRIDLSKFSLNSENRRIIRKTDPIKLSVKNFPLLLDGADAYHWSIGKLAKDFYEKKFGESIISANKVKGLLTSADSNFNMMFDFSSIGFTICYVSKEILHYSYPFYDLDKAPKDMGLGMMTRAIEWSKESGKKYAYLGSLQRPGDVYKLQFEGIEWFDGEKWQTDTDAVKSIL